MSIKKKFLYTLNLLLLAALVVSSQGVVLARPSIQAADANTPPLYPDAVWESVGPVQKDRLLQKERVTLSGEAFTTTVSFPDRNPQPVFDFYSSENLAALGWTFIGGVDVELAYKNEAGSYLTVEIEPCLRKWEDFCLTVWYGEATAFKPLKEADIIPFVKSEPANGSMIPVQLNSYQLLKWGDANTDYYEYCIDTVINSACDTGWKYRVSLYSGGPGDFLLSPGTTYEWQVRTFNPKTYANSGAWWTFTMAEYDLKKLTPANGAVLLPPSNTYRFLTWSDAGPPEYEYCVDRVNDNACNTGWVKRQSLYSGGAGDLDLSLEDTYYWQVRVFGDDMGADSNTWWSFTIQKFPLVYSIARYQPVEATTNAATVKYLVTFTEDVTGVGMDDFKLTTDGIIDASIVSVTNFGSNGIYLVEVDSGTGTGWLRLRLVDNDTIRDSDLNFLGGPGAGNGNKVGDTYNIKRPLVIRSSPVQDGWVLESGENTSVGGSVDNASGVIYIGDSATDSQYRAILSFRTGQKLPDDAVITSVTLKFKYAGKTGVIPFTTHGNLTVDLRKGAFNGSAVLEPADFEAPYKKTNVFSFTDSKVNDWYSQSMSAAYFPFINLIGITQFRLQFTQGDNDDLGEDILHIFSGDAAADNRPKLIIDFYVP